MSNTIRRVDVLKEMDLRETANGKPLFFSIQFYKKNGELVILNRAKSCGLNGSMKKNRNRGVQPVDGKGNPIGHVYPVSIDNIREFNGKRVTI